MKLLGYENYTVFLKAINRAIGACMSLNIQVTENFVQVEREIDNKTVSDYKLTRFACYLIAMNGDPKKPQVAKAQIYFISMAEVIRHYVEQTENIDRLIIREEITDREKSLSGVAKSHGVIQYGLFQNAGYRGMYNKNINELKKIKGLKDLKRSLLDFMGKEELAANLFRITQTEAKIKNEEIKGQQNLEKAAEGVGRKVRQTMIEISHTPPENLALKGDIQNVKKELKETEKKFKQIDKPSKSNKKKARD